MFKWKNGSKPPRTRDPRIVLTYVPTHPENDPVHRYYPIHFVWEEILLSGNYLWHTLVCEHNVFRYIFRKLFLNQIRDCILFVLKKSIVGTKKSFTTGISDFRGSVVYRWHPTPYIKIYMLLHPAVKVLECCTAPSTPAIPRYLKSCT